MIQFEDKITLYYVLKENFWDSTLYNEKQSKQLKLLSNMILEIFYPFREKVCHNYKKSFFYINQIGKFTQILNGYNRFFQSLFKTKSFEKNIAFLDDLSLSIEILEYYLLFTIKTYFVETNNIKLKVLKKYINKKEFCIFWLKTKFIKIKDKFFLFITKNTFRKIIAFILTFISFPSVKFFNLKKIILLIF